MLHYFASSSLDLLFITFHKTKLPSIAGRFMTYSRGLCWRYPIQSLPGGLPWFTPTVSSFMWFNNMTIHQKQYHKAIKWLSILSIIYTNYIVLRRYIYIYSYKI